MTDMRRFRKMIRRELIDQLRDRYIQLGMLWQDNQFKTWHAYGHWPREQGADFFRGDGDALVTVMAGGATADEAVEALIADPRLSPARHCLQTAVIVASIEIDRLAETIHAKNA